MPRLKIKAPDGKILRVTVSEDAGPDQFNAITKEVLAHYAANSVETPGRLKTGALGVMSGIPGAQTLTSAVSAIGDKTYEEAHKEIETLKKKGFKKHPFTYGAGKAAGFVGTALAAPVSVPGAVAIGVGAGLDVAPKPKYFLGEAAKGAGFGLGFGLAGKHIVGPAIKKVMTKFAPAIGTRAVAALGKPTTKQVRSYLKDPKPIREALTNPQASEKLADIVGDVGKVSGHLGEAARAPLSTTKAPLSMNNLLEVFDEAQQKYLKNGLPVTQANKIALRTLYTQFTLLIDIAKANKGKIPETTLQGIINQIQGSVKNPTWGNPAASASQDALKNLSGKLNSLLKKSNLAFKEAMEPVAETAALKSDIVKKFKLETDAYGKVSPTEATNVKMAGILAEGKTESQDLLQQLHKSTGIDFLKFAEAAKIRQAFEGEGSSQGVNVLMHTAGYGAGALSQVPGMRLVGSLMGGLLGHNIHGGRIAKKILDLYLSGTAKFSNSIMGKSLAKYGPLLVNAAKAGGNQLAATHFVLGTSDPEYQKLEAEIEDQ